MIDTIKLLIPIENREFLNKIKGKLVRTRRENLKTNELKFEFFTGELQVGSYGRTVNFYLAEGEPKGLFLEFSLPKQYLNNNVEMVNAFDVKYILNNFKADLCKHLKENLPKLSEWVVYRLDICYNWTFESEQECQSLMNFIQRIDFPRKKKHLYDTSVMYQGSAYIIKFYLKGAEFQKHDYKAILKTDIERAEKLFMWSKKVLRFEVGFKKPYLKTLFGKDKVKVSDIADNSVIENYLQEYLALVFRYVEKEKMKHENVRQVINDNFKPAKALRLYQFYKGYYFEPDEKFQIKKGLDPSTIWRYKKDLKKICVSFEENLGDSNFVAVQELVIPSEKGKFGLLDYQLTSDYS